MPSFSSGDPVHGTWSLADATLGLSGKGGLLASLDTSLGVIQCKLYEDKAPVTVANFVGLARGVRPWQEPSSREWVRKPAYNGTTFHRVIAGFMIQGGDPKGDGTGEPGYTIVDEIWPGSRHDRAGLLCMANRGPHTNGLQFFITHAPALFLDGNYTIFGECTSPSSLTVVDKIATSKVIGERPQTPVVIKSVTITREVSA